MTAFAARELDEAVLDKPASQIRIELLDELRQASVAFGTLAESRPVLGATPAAAGGRQSPGKERLDLGERPKARGPACGVKR